MLALSEIIAKTAEKQTQSIKGQMFGVIFVFSLYLALTRANGTVAEVAGEECPLWTINTNGSCECAGSPRLIVKCNPLNKSLYQNVILHDGRLRFESSSGTLSL